MRVFPYRAKGFFYKAQALSNLKRYDRSVEALCDFYSYAKVECWPQKVISDIESSEWVRNIVAPKTLKDIEEEKCQALKMRLEVDNHPTPYLYAYMSQQVYRKKAAIEPVGWRVLCRSDALPGDKKGYYGIAFLHESGKHIVVAHQGSQQSRDIASDMHIMLAKEPEQYELAEEFTELVMKKQGKIGNALVTHTGHSLGAVLAELCAYKHHTHATTFDSPGSKDIIESRGEPVVNDERQIVSVETYMSWPNVINTCNGHIGQLICLFPSVKPDKHLHELAKRGAAELYDFILSRFRINPDRQSDTLETIDITLKNVKGHGIDGILECFDKKTGGPRDKMAIARWPQGFNKALQFITFVAEHGRQFALGPRERFSDEDRYTLEEVIGYQLLPLDNKRVKLTTLDRRIVSFLVEYQKYREDFERPSSPVNMEIIKDWILPPDKEVLSLYRIEGVNEDRELVCDTRISPEHFTRYITMKMNEILPQIDSRQIRSTAQHYGALFPLTSSSKSQDIDTSSTELSSPGLNNG